MCRELFTGLGLPGQSPCYAGEFAQVLKAALSAYPRTLVLDEVQWLSSDQLEYVRYLWDDPYTRLAVVFVGGEGCYQTLRKEPMLSSRIFIWQCLARLTLQAVLEVIRFSTPSGQTRTPAASLSPTRTPPTATSAAGPS
ncbi:MULTISPECIES: ATP-binding protein [unclassified Kitasatospora]|uniref:ATP-binding protein n=1 Tax=unclassified Kitasatospora TaxID=2633591 RepID=UPI0033E08CFC